MVTDNVMFKIKSLLNMTVEHGCTPDEAATALEKAQALMFQNNVDIRDVNTGEVKDESGKIGMVEKEYDSVWKTILLNNIANCSMCRVVRKPSKKTFYLFGTKANVEMVLEMYNWIVLQLESMSLKDFNSYKRSGGYVNGKSWKNTYFIHAVRAIYARLKPQYDKFAGSTGTAIVVYNDKAVGEAVDRVFPKVINSKYHSRQNSGALYGKRAGENVSLSPQKKINNSGRLCIA